MANKRIEMIVLKQIIQLKEKGLSNRKIADQLGVHRNTINEYIKVLNHQDQSYVALLKLSEARLNDLFLRPAELPSDARYEALKSSLVFMKKSLKK